VLFSTLKVQGPIIATESNSFYQCLTNHHTKDTTIKSTYSLFFHYYLNHAKNTDAISLILRLNRTYKNKDQLRKPPLNVWAFVFNESKGYAANNPIAPAADPAKVETNEFSTARPREVGDCRDT